MASKPPGDARRKGDERPFAHDARKPLTFLPAKGEPFRWLPRHGEPSCVGEWLAQHLVKAFAWLPLYTAIIVTIIVLLEFLGVPFIEGR